MVSAINATKPVDGVAAVKADLRANLLAAKNEIEALQLGSAAGPVLNVKSFGAVGDGTTNDTAAIQSALDTAGQAGGGTVWLPKGAYSCNPLMLNYRNIHIVGQNVPASIARDATTWPVSLRARTGDVGAMIDSLPSGGSSNCAIAGVALRGMWRGETTGARLIGIRLRSSTCTITGCHFRDFGNQAILVDPGARIQYIVCNTGFNCMAFTDQTIKEGTVEIHSDDNYIWGGEYNCYIPVEGTWSPNMTKCSVLLNGSTNFVSDVVCEFGHIGLCVLGNGHRITSVRADYNAGHGIFVGRNTDHGHTGTNGHNQFVNVNSVRNGIANPNTYDGFHIDRAENNIFTGCYARQFSQGTLRHGFYDNTTGTNYNVYTGCWSTGHGTTAFNVGAGARVQLNPGAPKTLAANSTTPSVDQTLVVLTANTQATQITALLHGVPGQRVSIRAGDANTTLVNGATLVTNTGANKALTSGRVYSLLCIHSTLWVEES